MVLIVAITSEPTVAEEEKRQPYWTTNNSSHGYSVKSAKRGVRHSISTRKASKFWRCARSLQSARAVRAYWYDWKVTYKGYWKIQALKDLGVHQRLARLRYCESRGQYKIDTHHDGAYQYDTPTWAYGQAEYGVPRKHRTTYAYQASVNHQDVVTGYLFPREPSRWDASRHCWGWG